MPPRRAIGETWSYQIKQLMYLKEKMPDGTIKCVRDLNASPYEMPKRANGRNVNKRHQTEAHKARKQGMREEGTQLAGRHIAGDRVIKIHIAKPGQKLVPHPEAGANPKYKNACIYK